MAILNVTPDSFSDGGRLYAASGPRLDRVIDYAARCIEAGADLLDIGGESTRPGAAPVAVAEELARVVPVVEALARRFPVPVSVDTSDPLVMAEAAAVGAAMINDVRALQRPGAVAAAVAVGLPVCLMHMRGEPATMQADPRYRDVVGEVREFLAARVAVCVAAGMDRDRLLVDPGFGFGKHLEHNLALLRRLPDLAPPGVPVLVGLSRKRMIGELTGRAVGQRVHGSVALALVAALRGAAVIRVHDVAATVDALKIWTAVGPGLPSPPCLESV
jgi:dihydropteroate synthase